MEVLACHLEFEDFPEITQALEAMYGIRLIPKEDLLSPFREVEG